MKTISLKFLIFSFIFSCLIFYGSPSLATYNYEWPFMSNGNAVRGWDGVSNSSVLYLSGNLMSIPIFDPRLTGEEDAYEVLRTFGYTGKKADLVAFKLSYYVQNGGVSGTVCTTSSNVCVLTRNIVELGSISGITYREFIEKINNAVKGYAFDFFINYNDTRYQYKICSGLARSNSAVASSSYDNITQWIKDSAVFIGPIDDPTTTCLDLQYLQPDEKCTLVTPSVDFLFGTILRRNAQEATVSKNIQIDCTANAKFTLKLIGSNKMSLSNGMNAMFTFNGQDSGETIAINEGLNTINVVAKITDYDNDYVTAGPFEGQGVLVVSYL